MPRQRVKMESRTVDLGKGCICWEIQYGLSVGHYFSKPFGRIGGIVRPCIVIVGSSRYLIIDSNSSKTMRVRVDCMLL